MPDVSFQTNGRLVRNQNNSTVCLTGIFLVNKCFKFVQPIWDPHPLLTILSISEFSLLRSAVEIVYQYNCTHQGLDISSLEIYCQFLFNLNSFNHLSSLCIRPFSQMLQNTLLSSASDLPLLLTFRFNRWETFLCYCWNKPLHTLDSRISVLKYMRTAFPSIRPVSFYYNNL